MGYQGNMKVEPSKMKQKWIPETCESYLHQTLSEVKNHCVSLSAYTLSVFIQTSFLTTLTPSTAHLHNPDTKQHSFFRQWRIP